MFSRYLKEHGFKYQIDYFRDVKYSNFIDDYNTIKENCYEKKNVNHYVCKLPYYQDENNLKFFSLTVLHSIIITTNQ